MTTQDVIVLKQFWSTDHTTERQNTGYWCTPCSSPLHTSNTLLRPSHHQSAGTVPTSPTSCWSRIQCLCLVYAKPWRHPSTGFLEGKINFLLPTSTSMLSHILIAHTSFIPDYLCDRTWLCSNSSLCSPVQTHFFLKQRNQCEEM